MIAGFLIYFGPLWLSKKALWVNMDHRPRNYLLEENDPDSYL